MCRYCMSLVDMRCEVADGAERIRHCPGFREHLRHQPANRHPVYDIPDTWDEAREEYDRFIYAREQGTAEGAE